MRALPGVDEVTALLRSRLLSLRAYDARGMMAWADVVPGSELEAGIAESFAIERVAIATLEELLPQGGAV